MPPEAVTVWAGGVATAYLGKAAGSEKLYVNIDRLPAGTYSAKYHSHSLQEEFFLILSGTGTLRMDGEIREVRPGDFVAKPCGACAHQFYNPGPEPLEILDVGTVEKGDVAYYPDEQIVLLRDRREAFGPAGRLSDWSSDPNE
nr:cupin domain-containing protein [Clostridium sp. D33t1_170424_F3]